MLIAAMAEPGMRFHKRARATTEWFTRLGDLVSRATGRAPNHRSQAEHAPVAGLSIPTPGVLLLCDRVRSQVDVVKQSSKALKDCENSSTHQAG